MASFHGYNFKTLENYNDAVKLLEENKGILSTSQIDFITMKEHILRDKKENYVLMWPSNIEFSQAEKSALELLSKQVLEPTLGKPSRIRIDDLVY